MKIAILAALKPLMDNMENIARPMMNIETTESTAKINCRNTIQRRGGLRVVGFMRDCVNSIFDSRKPRFHSEAAAPVPSANAALFDYRRRRPDQKKLASRRWRRLFARRDS